MPTPVAAVVDGATHLHSGKVRDLYELPDGRLLMVASDRISAFDFILETPIPDKGEILTRMSLWWFERLADLVPHHVLSTDVPDAVRRPRRHLRAARHVPGRVRRPRLPDRVRPARLPRHRRGLRHRAAGRARGRQPAARADLHARPPRPTSATTTRTSRTTPWSRTVGDDAAADLRDPHARGVRAGPRRSPGSAASSWPTPSWSSGAAATARSCSPTRCSPPTRRASGRPTTGSPAAPSRRTTSRSCATGCSRPSPAGTARRARRRRRCPTRSWSCTRARYLEAFETLTGETW